MKDSKISKCKFCYMDIQKAMKKEECHYCYKRTPNGELLEEPNYYEENPYPITNDICNKCESYKSKYIEYPLTINEIDQSDWKNIYDKGTKEIGQLVKVRPCGEEYEGKTYLGILLGELPLSPTISFNNKTNVLNVGVLTNPCIFIPSLNKLIWGMESWWCRIENQEDFTNISDNDINNVWYVKLMKDMVDNKK